MALAYRVAPWLCGLMDSVLSVEGSQIYRQSAFNKKQVARKVHCRATKDVNTSKTAGARIEMLIVEGRCGVCLWCVGVRVTKRAAGQHQGQVDTLTCEHEWWMEGWSFPYKPQIRLLLLPRALLLQHLRRSCSNKDVKLWTSTHGGGRSYFI